MTTPDVFRLSCLDPNESGNQQSAPAALAPVSAALERRRQKVIGALRADPALRYAFDVVGASPGDAAARDVSVMLGLRDAGGQIVTGELRVPADRWPGLAVFDAFWRQAAERPPA